MAFTRNHINAFVIVGGDSDFIALVEKLKQYDKKVLVVGGRAFTSSILQKNCHEFIAYENLVGQPQVGQRRQAEKTRSIADTNLGKAFPLVRRALKVVADREVSPQLGLLKSTLLQLDSTFSERDYGASTFRDFIEKMAAAGYVKLKQVDRSLLVELAADRPELQEVEKQPVQVMPTNGQAAEQAPAPVAPGAPNAAQLEEGVRAMQEVFQTAKIAPHWPMYLRNVKQFIKNVSPSFDERRYGFQSFLEAVRSGQRAGLFRLERNRQGILRVFPGNQMAQPQAVTPPSVEVVEETPAAEQPMAAEEQPSVEEFQAEPVPVIDVQAEEIPETTQPEPTDFSLVPPPPVAEEKPVRKRRASPGIKRKTVAPRIKTAGMPVRRTRKKTSPPSEQESS